MNPHTEAGIQVTLVLHALWFICQQHTVTLLICTFLVLPAEFLNLGR